MVFKTTRLAVLLGCIAGLTGCATIFSGTTQTVNIQVVNAKTGEILEGANCRVVDGSGASYTVTQSPQTITVTRGGGSLQISCRKEGFHHTETAAGDSFNFVTVANVLFWPGLIVDAASGAYKKYPSHYVVSMSPEPTLAQTPMAVAQATEVKATPIVK